MAHLAIEGQIFSHKTMPTSSQKRSQQKELKL
jgi:hypothetical protein